MNMQISDKINIPILILVLCMILPSCKEEHDLYDVNEITMLPINSEKDKPKTSAQYISILYTNLFQEAIGPNRMLEAQHAIESIGDKQVAYDILVSKYMNDSDVILPEESFMRSDPETFVRETYKRFLIRQPTEAELAWMINYINSRPNLTPELFYFAFATSNEHFHY
jgi:hypothetical protein